MSYRWIRPAPVESGVGIVDQVRRASHKKNRIAMGCGFVLGGFVPALSYLIARYHVGELPMLWLLVGGGMTYSSLSVLSWAKVAFKHPMKALGFVIIMEGALIFVPDPWIELPSLVILVGINGLACGTNLILDSRESRQLARGKSRRR